MQQDDLGGCPAQQAVLWLPRRGWIDAREPQGGIVSMECVVAVPGGLLVIRDQPVFALAVDVGQIVNAVLQGGTVRFPLARQLDNVTGVKLTLRRLLESGDQGGGLDLAARQAVDQRRAGGNELRLPDNPVLAVRQIVPARIGGEIGVLADMGNEIPSLGVVEADAASRPFAAAHGVLPPFVRIHPIVAGLGDMARDPRPGRPAKESHAFGALRYGEQIGGGQQVIQKDLEPPVEQGRARDVALLTPSGPQAFVHLYIEKVGF